MDLVRLWFWLIAVTFTLYFLLEDFDLRVEILRLLLARKEAEERALTGTIGPFWDGIVLTLHGVSFEYRNQVDH